jgi:hypothetical protein
MLVEGARNKRECEANATNRVEPPETAVDVVADGLSFIVPQCRAYRSMQSYTVWPSTRPALACLP